MTIKQITKILNGLFIQYKTNSTIKYLLLDSRKITFPQHALFFAIRGQHHNGHHFLSEVYAKGVRNIVINESIDSQEFTHANIIKVKDVVVALQNLASYHRQQFQLPVVGITGSNGKTVVKEWLYQLLWQDYKLMRSPKSYNSQVGVPLSIWQLNTTHELALVEAGISQVGEMSKLANIIQPNMGIFTNIGHPHSQNFEDDGQKIREKLQLFQKTKYLFYCCNYLSITHQINKIHRKYKNTFNFKTITWHFTKKEKKNNEEADLIIFQKKTNEKYTTLTGYYKKKQISITIPFIDAASIENAAHCWLFMLHLGYPNSIIQARMKQLTPIEMRLELKAGNNNCSIINDCYNSDLKSLSIALDFLAQQNQHPQKTVILSDILQSKQTPKQLYQAVADLITQKQINRFIGIGKNIQACRQIFEKIPNLQTVFYPDTPTFLAQKIHFQQESILVKAARPFAFEHILQFLTKKAHRTVLEINLNAIAHNLKTYRQHLSSNTKIMLMVKAFSYGSGTYEIANLLQFNKVDYLAVAYTDEGVTLRKAGITLPIMVMNPEPSTFNTLVTHNLEPEIYSLAHLTAFQSYLANKNINLRLLPYPIHLKFDTGMHRLGFEEIDMSQLIQLLKNNKFLKIKSIFSHLAASDEAQHDHFSHEQASRFLRLTKQIEDIFPNKPITKHLLNSTGILRFPIYHFDMVRLGLGLYGVDACQQIQKELQTVSTLKTYISQIKTVKPSETIGYSRKGKLKQITRTATVSIGYGDGLNRRLSNGRGKMLLHKQLAPIIGNVCMDMCMLDITHIPQAQVGDEVMVFGAQLPVQQVAEWSETIPYEVLTSVNPRVKRVYFQE